jgi:phytoene/squalene synthetase
LKLVREVLVTITSGQKLDLLRFESSGPMASRADGRKILALETAADLDDYIYRVAGGVGEFWTKICRAHLFPKARLDEKQFIADGIRFGKGLQLVNILRDLPVDLKNGRCYLPRQRLIRFGLLPETLLAPENEAKFLPLFREYLDLAEATSGGGLALHQHAAVRTIPRAAGVCVADSDRSADADPAARGECDGIAAARQGVARGGAENLFPIRYCAVR